MSICGIASGELLDRRHMIGQTVVAHVAIVAVVECLGAERRAHRVELDDEEPKLGEGGVRAADRRRERPVADRTGLRPGIDVVDDRIAPAAVDLRRAVHQAIEIGDAVARLDGERNWKAPAEGEQAAGVGTLQLAHECAVGLADHRDRQRVETRIAVGEVCAGGRQRHVVVGVLRCEQLDARAVELCAIEVAEVGIAVRLAAARREVHPVVWLIDAQHVADGPRSARDLVLDGA